MGGWLLVKLILKLTISFSVKSFFYLKIIFEKKNKKTKPNVSTTEKKKGRTPPRIMSWSAVEHVPSHVKGSNASARECNKNGSGYRGRGWRRDITRSKRNHLFLDVSADLEFSEGTFSSWYAGRFSLDSVPS